MLSYEPVEGVDVAMPSWARADFAKRVEQQRERKLEKERLEAERAAEADRIANRRSSFSLRRSSLVGYLHSRATRR